MLSETLRPAPPFRLDLAVGVLRRRSENRIDRWDGRCYRRALALNDNVVEVAVTQTGPPGTPRLRVDVAGARVGADTMPAVTATLGRTLGVSIDMSGFNQFAARDPRLGPLARRFVGMKPPRFPTVFEALINAIACQQVTLTLGILLLGRLAEAFGPVADAGPVRAYAFPRPEDLAGRSPDELRPLGFSRQKARAMIELAGACAEGRLDLEALRDEPDDVARDRLLRLHGIGRWSAEYVLLRGLGRVHVFPGDDVGARNNLRRWLDLPGPLDYDAVRRVLAPWQPFAGLVYFHLLLDRLAESGALAEGPPLTNQ